MDYIKKLEDLIKENNGTIVTSDLENFNIPRIYLKKLMDMRKIERVKRGVYVAVGEIEDEMFYMQAKYPKIIYSHETALFVHELTDRTPFEYAVTVPSGYKVPRNVSDNSKIYYIKRELYLLGVITSKTSFGNEIKVYDVERTICDILRSRERIDIQIISQALKDYVRLKTTDFNKLSEYAKVFRVNEILKKYIEVLLWVTKQWA